jgi:hypothetical protein
VRLSRSSRASWSTKISIGRLDLHFIIDAKSNAIRRACVIASSEGPFGGLTASLSFVLDVCQHIFCKDPLGKGLTSRAAIVSFGGFLGMKLN